MLRFRPSQPQRGAFPGNKTPAMERTLNLTYNIQKCRSSLLWGLINVVILAIFIWDLSYKCPLYTTWFNYIEYIIVGILTLNTMYHFLRYFYWAFKTERVTVTPEQKRLLGIKDADPYYKVTNDISSTPTRSPTAMSKTPETSLHTTPLNWSAVSWRSGASPNDSYNYSQSSPSWVYYRGSPDTASHSGVHARSSPRQLHFADTSGIEFITDEMSLKQYLNDYEHYEKAMNASNPPEQTSNLLSSFWSHPSTQNPNEVSQYLLRNPYQLSLTTASTTINSPSGKSDDSGSPLNTTMGSEVWRRIQVDQRTLTQWNANLRMWISQTILERIVAEIDSINVDFQAHHLHDVRIGNVGLERLRKTAQTQVIQYIPTLKALLPFLEVSANQEYLVRRIRDLARGGCMSHFKWNSGGSYNGKEWDESLLTDAEIIIHVLSTYLDSQLLPLPSQPDAKPFSKEHFIRSTDKVPHQNVTLAIHQIFDKPPHFRLIVGDEVFEVSKGHNNLFHTILLFLFYVNKKEHGMLGKVNMGRSGVNMLWIIGGS